MKKIISTVLGILFAFTLNATVAVRVNANNIPRTVLIIFFIVLPYGLLINKI